jgi:hypothetical protein
MMAVAFCWAEAFLAPSLWQGKTQTIGPSRKGFLAFVIALKILLISDTLPEINLEKTF